MAPLMQTNVETLEDSKVRLSITVPEPEFDRAVDAAFKKLAREVRIDGFRPGKAPRKLLEARLGSDIARKQALQDGLPEFYAQAVIDNDIDVIGFPEIDITAGEDDGDVEFTAVVEVRPEVTLIGYDTLRVEIPFEAVDDEAVDRQIDAMRRRSAELVDSTRPLAEDDYATIDIVGSAPDDEGTMVEVDGLVASAFMYQVGSGSVVAELDEQLRGTKPGDVVEFDAELPERFGDRAGMRVSFHVEVTGAQEQVLPELNDEWASENSEHDTVETMRSDLEKRLGLMRVLQAQMSLNDRVLESLAALVPIPAPETLVDQEVQRRLRDLQSRLQQQGLGIEQYLAMSGIEPQSFLDQAREGAQGVVLADLALRAVINQEQIAATDEEIDAEIQRLAEEAGQKPDKARRQLEKNGYLEVIARDLARGKALKFLVDHAQVVDQKGEPLDLTLPEDAAAATVPATSTTDESAEPAPASAEQE